MSPAYELARSASMGLRRNCRVDRHYVRHPGPRHYPYEPALHARHDVYARPRPRKATGIRSPLAEWLAVFPCLRRGVRKLAPRDVVARRGYWLRAWGVCVAGRHALSAGDPPANGQRAVRSDADAAAGAA